MKRKKNVKEFYSHVPKKLLKQVLEVNSNFERIGPFELPIELPSKKVVIFRLNHYFFFKSKSSYYAITRKRNKFSNPLLRIESVCNYAHIFNSRRCDCRYQLMSALEKINSDRDGLVIFCLNQHGKSVPGGTRGHALIYALGQLQNQDLVYDAYVKNGFKEDYRDFTDVVTILRSLNIKKVRLLSNNPKRLKFLKSKGFAVTHIPHEKKMDAWVSEELHFKKEKLNHLLKCKGFKEKFLKRYKLKAVKINR
jgi:GTP cyclohydrolase II